MLLPGLEPVDDDDGSPVGAGGGHAEASPLSAGLRLGVPPPPLSCGHLIRYYRQGEQIHALEGNLFVFYVIKKHCGFSNTK